MLLLLLLVDYTAPFVWKYVNIFPDGISAVNIVFLLFLLYERHSNASNFVKFVLQCNICLILHLIRLLQISIFSLNPRSGIENSILYVPDISTETVFCLSKMFVG